MQDVVNVSIQYATRACPELPSQHSTKVLPVLKNYLLEELSMFIYLYDMGYPVEVYPGSDLDLMRRIAIGEYGNFPFKCPERSHISIEIAASAEN